MSTPTQGLDILSSTSHDRLLTWGLAVAGATAAAGTLWWLTRESYYSYVPPRYQYRPGTFTAWISRVLDRHAKRRRSRFRRYESLVYLPLLFFQTDIGVSCSLLERSLALFLYQPSSDAGMSRFLFCMFPVYVKAGHRPIRVYMDGCFDLMHYGHANALRQARALGDQLVVGLVPDSEIRRCKGPPLMSEPERLEMVESVKWVDEVLTGVPYDLTPEFLDDLIHKHRIDYVIHGDDPCILPDGTDAYAYAKKMGRFRMIKRTEGVSTTDIVGRLLMCSRDGGRVNAERAAPALAREFSMGRRRGTAPLEAFKDGSAEEEALQKEFAGCNGTSSMQETNISGEQAKRDDTVAKDREDSDTTFQRTPTTQSRVPGAESHGAIYPSSSGPVRVSRFLPTSRRIVQFSSGRSAPPGARIVYIDGAFDLFHVGHVAILKAARAQGDFLLVGIHSDEEVRARRGPHLPVMGLHERALSVLACRFADEVVIGEI